MTTFTPRIVELTEYQTRTFDEDELTETEGKELHASYGKQISVEPPSFQNNQSWQLTSQGWGGYIPLTDSFHLSLVPKVSIANLFRMLEYAYRLDFRILEGLADSESIAELYERLALVLARRILYRIRKGLYRSYVSESDDLPYVRGRVDVVAHLRNSRRVVLPCSFEEHTADLEDKDFGERDVHRAQPSIHPPSAQGDARVLRTASFLCTRMRRSAIQPIKSGLRTSACTVPILS